MNEAPGQYLNNRIAKISAPVKAAVISAFIIGLIAHIASITGFILNWDSLIIGRENSYKFIIEQGKWLIPVIRYLSKVISIGSVVSVLSIVLISLSAGMVVSILTIKNNIYAGLTGAVMVLFPTVMNTFFYDGEDVFFTSLFLSVLAVYIVKNCRHGYIWGTLVLTLSLGTYQAYIDVTATLFLLICLCELLNNQTELKKTLTKGLKYIAVLIVSIALYYIVLQIILKLTGIALSGYRGINHMGSINIANLGSIFIQSYLKPIRFMIFNAYGGNDLRLMWLYRLSALCIVILLVKIACATKLLKNAGKAVTAALLLVIMPLSLHAIGILGQNPNTHWLMIYSFVFVFVFLIKLADMSESVTGEALVTQNTSDSKIKKHAWRALQWFSILLCATLSFEWFVLSNRGYTAMKVTYESVYATCLQIIDDISNQEGINKYTPIAIIVEDNNCDYRLTPIDIVSEYNYTGLAEPDSVLAGTEYYYAMIEDYFLLKFNWASDYDISKIMQTEEYQSMTTYPYSGYTQEIEGVIVVKIRGENGGEPPACFSYEDAIAERTLSSESIPYAVEKALQKGNAVDISSEINLDLETGMLYIQGWCVDPTTLINGEIYLRVGEQYFPAYRSSRPDVAKALGIKSEYDFAEQVRNTENENNFGFVAVIDPSALEAGQYDCSLVVTDHQEDGVYYEQELSIKLNAIE